MGCPSVYPTKTTVYKKDQTWNGYTLFNTANNKGAVLIDMNGNEIHAWPKALGALSKMLPNGDLLCCSEIEHNFQCHEDKKIVQLDWYGNVIWSFDRFECLVDEFGIATWSARTHHDYQREGNPVGYYSPELLAKTDSGNSLLLCHRNIQNKQISNKPLLDDVIVEIDWQGNIIWEWAFNDHFFELGFDQIAKKVIYHNPNLISHGEIGDYLHINSLSRLGPNKHFDNGHPNFHPDNIIWSSREANIVGITSRQTGKVVWQIGPDYTEARFKHLDWMIGQHHAHLIPKGLPGAGNILLFDNGWKAGYGQSTPNSSDGLKNACRDYSRVLEIDPISFEIIWQYSANEQGTKQGAKVTINKYQFYSPHVSSAQRLLNGNTLITEGSNGRLIEVTKENRIVWEYISPYQSSGLEAHNKIYRAYRVPYDWLPQLSKGSEIALPDIDNRRFHIKG
ncbi:TPA: aryl-sulfate sulfotransferase [Providencia stuartii]|nr:aryl-sulfate sulfotransferase [Providencia stuartii]